ncbi:unnamed protein product, partial [Polarella glacialis]
AGGYGMAQQVYAPQTMQATTYGGSYGASYDAAPYGYAPAPAPVNYGGSYGGYGSAYSAAPSPYSGAPCSYAAPADYGAPSQSNLQSSPSMVVTGMPGGGGSNLQQSPSMIAYPGFGG